MSALPERVTTLEVEIRFCDSRDRRSGREEKVVVRKGVRLRKRRAVVDDVGEEQRGELEKKDGEVEDEYARE